MLEYDCESHFIWTMRSLLVHFSVFNHMLQNNVVEIERQFVEKLIYNT